MRKLLLLSLPVLFLLTSCDLFNNFGKKVKINDKLSVYYKGDSVTEADAKKMGAFLEANRGGNKDELTAQITKDGEAYVVRMPVNEEAFNKDKEKFEKLFWFMQDLISENVFEGKKTKVILTDNKLKDKLVLDEITRITVGKEHYVYLKGNSIKEKDAKEIAEKFEKENIFSFTQGAVMLTKEKGNLFVRFLANVSQVNNGKETYYATLSNLQYLVGKYVLEGEDVKLVIIDEEFNDVKDFDELTADKKTLLDMRMNGDQQQTNEPYTQTQYNTQDQTQDATTTQSDDDQ